MRRSMTKFALAVAASFSCVFCANSSSHGQDGVEVETDVDRSAEAVPKLVKLLASPKFSERERATAALLRIGEPALTGLANFETPNLEMQQRVDAIRERLLKLAFRARLENVSRRQNGRPIRLSSMASF